MRPPVASLTVLLGLLGACFVPAPTTASGDTDCGPGMVGCACLDGMVCAGDLTCSGGLCMEAGTTGTGGTTESGASSGPATAATDGTTGTTADGTTGTTTGTTADGTTGTTADGTTGATTLETGSSETTTGSVACRHRMFVSTPLPLASIPKMADVTCRDDAMAERLGGEDWIAVVPLGGQTAAQRFTPCAPVDRLADRTSNVVTVVEMPSEFWTGMHEGPIDVDASGATVDAAVRVFSGSTIFGEVLNDCNEWTPANLLVVGAGNPSAVDATWITDVSPSVCIAPIPRPVYCAEVLDDSCCGS